MGLRTYVYDGSSWVEVTPVGGAAGTPTGISSITGTSPIGVSISGNTAAIALNANYQTVGTYVSSASATSPISVSLSSTGLLSLSIDSSATSAASASRTRSLVRNTTGFTISKGSFVYIDGSAGTVPTIQQAIASSDATSARTFGIVESDISNNTDGYVTNQGLITGINTSSFADGDVLWLSPTISGAATTVKPAGPNHGVLLGIVVKGGSVGAGSIYVFIKNGVELDEIHDVNISGLQNGDTLIWSSTASVWQNQTLANAGISPSSHTHTYISAVVGTSPASVSTTAGTSTVSIVAGSINSTHLSATSVGSTQLIDASITSAKIAAAAVDTSKINSGAALANYALLANGTGGAAFLPIGAISVSSFTANGTYTVPSGANFVYVYAVGGGAGGQGGAEAVGGAGGSGGAVSWRYFRAIDLAVSTYSVVVGSGGASAAGNSGITRTSSNAGGNTTFGTNLLVASGGPANSTNGTAQPTAGRIGIVDTTGTIVADGTNPATGSSGTAAADAVFGPAAGASAPNSTARSGAAGGSGFGKYAYTAAGGNGGAGGTYVTGNGAAGSNGTGFGDGGGSGSSSQGTSGFTGGNGGNGAFPGGGGGGGGATNSTSTANGGNGGAGGSGWCLVIAG